MAIVEQTLDAGVGTLILNNTAKRNALSAELIEQASSAFQTFRTGGARVVILRAPAGSRVFSAGHDVNELPRKGRDPLGYNDPLEIIIRTIRHFPAPVVCMIEGSVWGGACELCLSCDLVVCEHSVTFAATPAKLGVPYNTTGLLNIRNALGPRLVRQMLFTAQPVPALRLFEMGVVSEILAGDQLEARTLELARQICRLSPLSIAVMKEQLRILDNASPLSPETFERLQGLRREVYDSKDYEEGIEAFIGKRSPSFTGK